MSKEKISLYEFMNNLEKQISKGIKQNNLKDKYSIYNHIKNVVDDKLVYWDYLRDTEIINKFKTKICTDEIYRIEKDENIADFLNKMAKYILIEYLSEKYYKQDFNKKIEYNKTNNKCINIFDVVDDIEKHINRKIKLNKFKRMFNISDYIVDIVDDKLANFDYIRDVKLIYTFEDKIDNIIDGFEIDYYEHIDHFLNRLAKFVLTEYFLKKYFRNKYYKKWKW